MSIRFVLTALVLAACGTAARADIGFAENQSDRIRLWNTGYYELAFRKADGRLLYIVDQTTGQQVSPGNVHGPWVLKFSDNTWLDGENFSPTNSSRRFTYSWNAQTSVLTLQYAATGTYACTVTLTVTATEGPEVNTTLSLTNGSMFEIQLLSYPVNLSFLRSQIDAVYMPYMEGMRLQPSFFPSYDFVGRYPGRMFADFAYTDLTTGSFAVYVVQPPQTPIKPVSWMILRDTYAGGVNKYHHDYETAVPAGGSWSAPTTVLSVGTTLPQAMATYWSRCGHDAMPTLSEKLGPTLLSKLSGAVFLKRDFLQGGWTFSAFQNFLPNLPAGSLLHLVSFWPRGFDENYPDYLPPNSALGTLADLQTLVANARAAGHLVMPYTNPTWWDDQSPTMATLGTGVAVRNRSGSLIYETYSGHGGYVVCPHAPEVIACQDETRLEFTQTVPCDFLFEDQLGARDAPNYAAHGSAPDALRYTQGLADVAARTAACLPNMTEGGYDRLAWAETGFCNTLRLAWYAWPDSTFTPYPLAPLWAHGNLYFNCHNLAGTEMANDLPSLTYYVSMGYALSCDLAALDANWLNVLDSCQKQLIAPLIGQAMTSFELLPTSGQSRTTFGDGTTITANQTSSALAQDDHVIAASGFLATRDATVLGGVLTTLHGQALSGSSPHYLFFSHADGRITIRQPRGDDGPLMLPRPSGWADDARIHAVTISTAGNAVSQPVTVGSATVQVNYLANVAGQATRYLAIVYCRPGDADCDGAITADDLQALASCAAGPEVAPGQTCLDIFDIDGDGDVDLGDCAALQIPLSGAK